MKPLIHLFASAIIAIALYPIFGWKVIFVVAGGFLIDIDHYFWYIYEYKKLSLSDCYRHFSAQYKKNNFDENTGILLVFHTVEFLFFVIILSIYNQLALIFAIGLLLHYLMDIIWHITVPKKVIANHSIIWWLVSSKIQKI